VLTLSLLPRSAARARRGYGFIKSSPNIAKQPKTAKDDRCVRTCAVAAARTTSGALGEDPYCLESGPWGSILAGFDHGEALVMRTMPFAELLPSDRALRLASSSRSENRA